MHAYTIYTLRTPHTHSPKCSGYEWPTIDFHIKSMEKNTQCKRQSKRRKVTKQRQNKSDEQKNENASRTTVDYYANTFEREN